VRTAALNGEHGRSVRHQDLSSAWVPSPIELLLRCCGSLCHLRVDQFGYDWAPTGRHEISLFNHHRRVSLQLGLDFGHNGVAHFDIQG